MPRIQAEVALEGFSPEQVWDVVTDRQALAAHAEHVLTVRSRPDDDIKSPVSEWTVLMNGSEVTWEQRETAEPQQRLHFTQLRGELEEMSGEWTLRPEPTGTRLTLSLSFDLGIDGLAPLLDPIWSQAFLAHAHEVLRAVETAIAKQEAPR